MSDQVVIVTAPDDFIQDSFRILLVDLDESQTQLVSAALLQLNHIGKLVVYKFSSGDSIAWLLDKKNKSNLIIFNADSKNEQLVGYMCAQRKSCYFGTLKSLHLANKSAIYSVEDVVNLLTLRMRNNETI